MHHRIFVVVTCHATKWAWQVISPKTVIDKLQRVMNAAARIVSGTQKYDRGLTQLLHAELHWLDVADRVTYKLGWMAYN